MYEYFETVYGGGPAICRAEIDIYSRKMDRFDIAFISFCASLFSCSNDGRNGEDVSESASDMSHEPAAVDPEDKDVRTSPNATPEEANADRMDVDSPASDPQTGENSA